MCAVNNIMPEDDASAYSLLVVEVITPSGHTSLLSATTAIRTTYRTRLLEETVIPPTDPPRRSFDSSVYTDDRSLSEAMVLEGWRRDALVPKVSPAATHSYDLYYLNVIAGQARVEEFHNAAEHEWLLKA